MAKPNMDREEELCRRALVLWGIEMQLWIAVEEAGELIHAISQMVRCPHDGKRSCVAMEIADVEIMLEQLKIGLGVRDKVERYKSEKLDRLEQRLEAEAAS